MELAIVVIFLIYIGYREWMVNARIKDLELKAFSKTPQEYAVYKSFDTPVKRKKEEEDDDLIEAEDVNVNDALKGINRDE